MSAGVNARLPEIDILIEHYVFAKPDSRPRSYLVLGQVRIAVTEKPAADID